MTDKEIDDLLKEFLVPLLRIVPARWHRYITRSLAEKLMAGAKPKKGKTHVNRRKTKKAR